VPVPEHFLAPILGPLNATLVPYMVTGGAAAIIYGEPRVTLDVDLVLVLPRARVAQFAEAFPAQEYYVPPVEVLEDEASRETRGHFNLLHHATGLRADCYLAGRDPLHEWALPLRRKMDLGGLDAWIACPEYVIVRKLQYFSEGRSEKHLRDVSRVVELLGDGLDEAAVSGWVARLALESEWAAARAYDA
jgi:hypothetical protein